MKVGFIGLGTMGGGMSLNIRKAGYDMVVHDLRRRDGGAPDRAGCEWADSPQAGRRAVGGRLHVAARPAGESRRSRSATTACSRA